MSHFADDETLTHIAALEAEIVRLRDVIFDMAGEEPGISWGRARKALSTPFTPTALPELIEKVEKIWREKCASRLDSEWNGDADTYEYSEVRNECAERIRALPIGQINLGELT